MGKAVGVNVRLENGVTGLIPSKSLSDKEVTDPTTRVRVGQTIHARIEKVDIDKFRCILTSRTSDLLDKDRTWALPLDPYYDHTRDEQDRKAEVDKREQIAKQSECSALTS